MTCASTTGLPQQGIVENEVGWFCDNGVQTVKVLLNSVASRGQPRHKARQELAACDSLMK